jgi:Cof subfamily protein (haloacid dehalogenase superfamily)
MENISLVLCDLDGTLFHDDKSISGYTKETIKKLQQKGILFGICTSRAYVNAVKFLDGIEPDICITNGGGMVRLGEKKIYSCQFSVEEVRTLINATFKILGPDAIISADNETGLYSNSKEELGDKFWTFNDFLDFREPAMKMCIETLDHDKVSQIAASIGPDRIDFLPFSDIPWYKMTLKDATKEKAITQLSKVINIPLEQIAAFGDDFSDIRMLKLCGHGIAMDNAIEQVKKIASGTCPSNEEDGVARWLEKQCL